MKSVKCPYCGKDTEFEDDWKEGFCLICGEKIVLQEDNIKIEENVVQNNNNVEVIFSKEVDSNRQENIGVSEASENTVQNFDNRDDFEKQHSVDNKEGLKVHTNARKEDSEVVNKSMDKVKTATAVFSILSLVNGIMSLLLGWIFIGIINVILGVVFGVIGLKRKRLKGCAIAGIITSGFGILFIVLTFFITVYPEIKSTNNIKVIREYIDRGAYSDALSMSDELFLMDSDKYDIKYEIYTQMEDYDAAAELVLEKIDGYKDVLKIPQKEKDRIDSIYIYLSENIKDRVDDLNDRIAKAQEEKELKEKQAEEERLAAENQSNQNNIVQDEVVEETSISTSNYGEENQTQTSGSASFSGNNDKENEKEDNNTFSGSSSTSQNSSYNNYVPQDTVISGQYVDKDGHILKVNEGLYKNTYIEVGSEVFNGDITSMKNGTYYLTHDDSCGWEYKVNYNSGKFKVELKKTDSYSFSDGFSKDKYKEYEGTYELVQPYFTTNNTTHIIEEAVEEGKTYVGFDGKEKIFINIEYSISYSKSDIYTEIARTKDGILQQETMNVGFENGVTIYTACSYVDLDITEDSYIRILDNNNIEIDLTIDGYNYTGILSLATKSDVEKYKELCSDFYFVENKSYSSDFVDLNKTYVLDGKEKLYINAYYTSKTDLAGHKYISMKIKYTQNGIMQNEAIDWNFGTTGSDEYSFYGESELFGIVDSDNYFKVLNYDNIEVKIKINSFTYSGVCHLATQDDIDEYKKLCEEAKEIEANLIKEQEEKEKAEIEKAATAIEDFGYSISEYEYLFFVYDSISIVKSELSIKNMDELKNLLVTDYNVNQEILNLLDDEMVLTLGKQVMNLNYVGNLEAWAEYDDFLPAQIAVISTDYDELSVYDESAKNGVFNEIDTLSNGDVVLVGYWYSNFVEYKEIAYDGKLGWINRRYLDFKFYEN